MKINQADEKVLTTLFGKEVVEKLSGALKEDDGEVSLGLRLNGRVVTQEQEIELKEVGIQQGKEIGYKEIAKFLDVELKPGEKDPIVIGEKFKTSVTTEMEEKYKGQTPTEELVKAVKKTKEWEDKYNALHGTHETISIELEKEKENFLSLQKEIGVKDRNNKILSSLPEKINQDRNDALLIITNTFEFDDSDGKQVIKRNGEIIRNGAGEPETLDNIISGFVEEKKWIRGAGTGQDDSDPGKKPGGYTPELAHKYLKDNNIEPASVEGIAKFNELTRKVTV